MSCVSPLLLLNLKGLRVEQSRICSNFHVSIGDVEVGVSLGFSRIIFVDWTCCLLNDCIKISRGDLFRLDLLM